MLHSIGKLQKEHAIYKRLEPLQGHNIPVCFGLIDLRELGQIYYHDIDVRIVYFLLLSFGGSPFEEAPAAAADQARIHATVQSVVEEMHSLGVVHGDVVMRNVLQGPNGMPILIDFDKGHLLPVAATRTSNKRKRVQGLEGKDEAGSDAVEVCEPLDAETRSRIYEDKANARALF